ncbi:Aste57867_22489 [Aphanomyces stellatus]|uniref:Aste57867_22489 protein n=1 Tax=Aphanomyces stellatus TaxID=120398 RepID=A0A485LKD6_9STRA|nr:hypothetical protein As57867_022419 [Aphanomyces stellatus]VFT99149.1 Aste57867_22489 [Aphanomyces stellatus]
MSATTEALTRKLSELHGEVSSLKGQIVEAVRVFYGSSANMTSSISIDEAMQFSAKWSRQGGVESDVQIRMKELESILDDTVSQLQPSDTPQDDEVVCPVLSMLPLTTTPQLQQSMAAKTRLHTQIQQSQEMLHLLRVLSQLDGLFQSFDANMDQQQLEAAATELASMEALVEEEKAAPIMQLMHVQRVMRKNQLQCALDEQVDAVCLIQAHKIELFPPQNLWAALAAAKRLQHHLDTLASSIMRHILQPLLTNPELVPHVHAHTLTLSSKPTPSSSSPSTDDSFATVLQHVLVVFQFLHGKWKDNTAALGPLLWKAHLFEPLEALFLENLPSDLADVPRFKNNVQPLVHGFDASMRTMGWALSSSALLEHLDSRFAMEKRRRVLVSIRHSMQKDYMDSVVVKTTAANAASASKKGKTGPTSTADDARTSDLRVSLCATKLWAQVDTLLQEASQEFATTDVASVLFHTARDGVFLFRMGMGSMYKEALVQDPRVVMLLHNDCMFLTRHMLTCVYPLKAALPTGVSMVDMIPETREFGEHSLMHFAKTHSDKMLQSLQTCPTWRDVHDDAAFNQVETCIKVILFQFERIIQHWKDGLAPAVYATLVSRMVQPLLQHMMDSLLRPPQSPLKAVHSVHHLFSLWHQEVNATFFTSRAMAEKHVSNWTKFQLLTQLMEESVMGVQDKWTSGRLKEFSKDNMTALVKCLFPDSTQRQGLLTVIQKATSSV